MTTMLLIMCGLLAQAPQARAAKRPPCEVLQAKGAEVRTVPCPKAPRRMPDAELDGLRAHQFVYVPEYDGPTWTDVPYDPIDDTPFGPWAHSVVNQPGPFGRVRATPWTGGRPIRPWRGAGLPLWTPRGIW